MKSPHMIIEVAIFDLDKFCIHNLNVDDHLRGQSIRKQFHMKLSQIYPLMIMNQSQLEHI
jgi:hypothetical protein